MKEGTLKKQNEKEGKGRRKTYLGIFLCRTIVSTSLGSSPPTTLMEQVTIEDKLGVRQDQHAPRVA